MSKLEPVTISYNGKDYTVDKESSIWGLIEAVEDVITHLELMNCYATRKFTGSYIQGLCGSYQLCRWQSYSG